MMIMVIVNSNSNTGVWGKNYPSENNTLGCILNNTESGVGLHFLPLDCMAAF